MSQPGDPGHPVGPEIDDSQNPTEASPSEVGTDSGPQTDPGAGHSDDGFGGDQEQPGGQEQSGWQEHSSSRQHEMLRQLQDMIDQVARDARPVMREFAAKSAELAALAAQKAGPLAVRAAEKTQVYGERFAARSKEMAAELRRQEAAENGPAEEPETVAGVPDQGGPVHPWGETTTASEPTDTWESGEPSEPR